MRTSENERLPRRLTRVLGELQGPPADGGDLARDRLGGPRRDLAGDDQPLEHGVRRERVDEGADALVPPVARDEVAEGRVVNGDDRGGSCVTKKAVSWVGGRASKGDRSPDAEESVFPYPASKTPSHI